MIFILTQITQPTATLFGRGFSVPVDCAAGEPAAGAVGVVDRDSVGGLLVA
jgi:hypothetical protein